MAIRFDSLDWKLSNPSNITPNNFIVHVINPVIDSTNIRDGKQVNWYSCPAPYKYIATYDDTQQLLHTKVPVRDVAQFKNISFP